MQHTAMVMVMATVLGARVPVATSMVHLASLVFADTPSFTPTGGAPGSGAVQELLNWGGWFALAASLAGIIIGAGMWAHSSTTGSYGGVHRGKQYVLGGAIGALLLGVAPLLISTFFTTGQS